MLKIKLLRVGRKHDPSYRVVVVDSKKGPHTRLYVEKVGFHNPVQKKIELKEERIKYWISKGAQPTDVVHNILVSKNIVEGKKVDVSSHRVRKSKGEESDGAPASAEATADKNAVEDKGKEEKAEEPTAEEIKEAPTIAEGDVGVPTPPEEDVGKEEKKDEEKKDEEPKT